MSVVLFLTYLTADMARNFNEAASIDKDTWANVGAVGMNLGEFKNMTPTQLAERKVALTKEYYDNLKKEGL